MRSGPYRPQPGGSPQLHVTPDDARWRYLGASVVEVQQNSPWRGRGDGRETAIVVLSGEGTVKGGGLAVQVSRRSVFDEIGRVVYLPPGTEYSIESGSSLVVAIGTAPADGLLPARCIEPAEMR
ncbi:MAG: 5-deoxy-glucuronate isomerase, partial [Ilumatobacteraceae bacterium]